MTVFSSRCKAPLIAQVRPVLRGECGPKFELGSGIEPDVAGASNQPVPVVFELPLTIVERDPFLTLTVVAL